VELVENTFASWRGTLWPAVDVDAMLMHGTKLQKEVKLLVKQSRGWDVYVGLAKQLSDMLVALPLVQVMMPPPLHPPMRPPKTQTILVDRPTP